MWFFRASMRVTFRILFDRFYVKTRRVLCKDLQCDWIILCRLLDNLSHHMEANGGEKTTVRLLDIITDTLTSSLETISKLDKVLRRRSDHASWAMIERVRDYESVVAKANQAAKELTGKVQSGVKTRANLKVMKREVRKPLMTDKRVKELITEPIIQKTIGKLGGI